MSARAAEVIVYTRPGCWHCERPRRRLRRHDVAFREVRGEGESGFRHWLLELTVPQVVIDGEAVGGAELTITDNPEKRSR